MYSLKNGYFYKGDKIFFPCGFNYMSSETGFQIWKDWKPHFIERDMEEISKHGFNTIRILLLWPDFEPSPGKYSKDVLEHLDEFARIAGKYNLNLIPTLFIGWGSGGRWGPPGCEGRDIFKDKGMVKLQASHARKVTSILKSHKNILAIDIGSEPASLLLSDSDRGTINYRYIEYWAGEIVHAVKEEDPDCLVTIGTDHTSCVRDNGFRYDKLPVDFLCVHGYPVWSPFAIEGLNSYRASYYIPFMTNFAFAFKPVMLEEFGFFSIMAQDDRIAHYFDVVTHSSYLNKSNGWLSWCWRDIETEAYPYKFMPQEKTLGAVRADFSPKPQIDSFKEFYRDLEGIAQLKFDAADIGIYITDSYYADEEHMKSWRSTEEMATSYYYSFMLLKANTMNCEFFKSVEDARRYKAVFLPCAHNLNINEIRTLEKYVHEGGELYLSAGGYLTGYEKICGVKALDVRLYNNGGEMDIFDKKLRLGAVKGHYITYIQDGAEIIGTSGQNKTNCFINRIGKGISFFVPVPIERMMDRQELFPDEWRTWVDFYNNVLDKIGYLRKVRCDNSMLEIMPARDVSDNPCLYIVNHSDKEEKALVEFQDKKKKITAMPCKSMVIEFKGKAEE